MDQEITPIEIEALGDKPVNPFENTLQLFISFHKLGTTRRVKEVATVIKEGSVDVDWVGVSKQILKSDTITEINALYTKVRKFLQMYALPAPSFKKGIWLIPFEYLTPVDNYIESVRTEELPPLVEKLLSEYEDMIKQAAEALKLLNNPNQFPSKEDVGEAFGIRKKYVEWGKLPSHLKELNPTIFKRELEEGRSEVVNMMEDFKLAMRAGMQELINHMVERLSPDTEGKKKTFHKTSIDKLWTFLETFKNKNLADDKELEALAEQSKALLEGVDPEQLRKNPEFRQNVLEKFSEVKTALDTMLIDKPKRKLVLDDEESI